MVLVTDAIFQKSHHISKLKTLGFDGNFKDVPG